MYKPQSILCWWLPAKRNGKWNHIGDGELTHFKCWRQNCTLHPTSQHTQHTNNERQSVRVFVHYIETRRHDGLSSRGESHLKRTSSGDSFVCIKGGADIFAEKLADSLLDRWDSSGSSNYLHCIDVVPAQLCHTEWTVHIVFTSKKWLNSSLIQRTYLIAPGLPSVASLLSSDTEQTCLQNGLYRLEIKEQ